MAPWRPLGFKGDPHSDPLHILSNVLILVGFILLYMAWKVLYAAQRERRFATTGPYAYVRHPQYIGFIAILAGFLVQWPTLLTLLMFPVLVSMYVNLARREEREARETFGEAWDAYAADLASRHPWESLERHLGSVTMDEVYFGFAYIARGTAQSALSRGRDEPIEAADGRRAGRYLGKRRNAGFPYRMTPFFRLRD